MNDFHTEPDEPTQELLIPPNNKKSYFGVALSLAVVIALADQLTKLWILNLFSDESAPLNVLGEALRFTLIYNYGGALGTNFGSPMVYLIMGLLIFAGLIYYLWSARFIKWFALTLGLIAGGAIGNLTDRVRLGKVVDWIDVDIPDISLLGYDLARFWTFNIADSAITVALGFLVWKYLRGQIDYQQETEPNSAALQSDTPPDPTTPSPKPIDNELI